jgi:hypothetical protein
MRAASPSGFRSTFGLPLFLLLFSLSDLQTLLHRFCFSFFRFLRFPRARTHDSPEFIAFFAQILMPTLTSFAWLHYTAWRIFLSIS